MKKQTQIDNDTVLFNASVLKELAKSSQNLKYGQLLISVHNGRIVQIDKTEKLRFQQSPVCEKGSGI